MMDVDISPSNRYAAAYTNNSQIIIVDNLTNEYKVKESPFLVTNGVNVKNYWKIFDVVVQEGVRGLVMLDDCVIVHSSLSWAVLDTEGQELTRSSELDPMMIVRIEARNTKHVNIIRNR